MRIALILLGAVISTGALLFWLYLNALAASWSTSNRQPSIDWFDGEAFAVFWLPFALGAAIFVIGWRLRKRP